MQVCHTIEQCRHARADLGTVALVPTMGALHAGHVSLIHEARRQAPRVAVSLFVNPTQFGPREDFARYPRPVEKDLEICSAEGVDLAFCPVPEEMYPPGGTETVIDFPALTTVLEGKHRPGHFRGVCQIVAKLFNIVQPQFACFGQKDLQQLRVIQALVRELDFPLEIVPCPTLRDPDGMAMSSRNVYLSADDRRRGLTISKALAAAGQEIQDGVRQSNRIMATMRNMLLAEHLLVDYAAAVDALTLQPVEVFTRDVALLIAARVGATRLIDNRVVPIDRP